MTIDGKTSINKIQLRSEPVKVEGACDECGRIPTGEGADKLYVLVNGQDRNVYCEIDCKEQVWSIVTCNDSSAFVIEDTTVTCV